MSKNVLIVLLVGLVVWFGGAVIRLERMRYASSLNMCANFKPFEAAKRDRCLSEARPRTNPAYDLLYGLRIL